MKIGILTFHSSINPGSILQAYCVFNLLKDIIPNANIELINLIPYNREIREWRFIKKNPPFIHLENIKNYLSARKFIRDNISLSKRVYFRNLKSQIDYINSQNYDFIFTGSDTVWMHSNKLDGSLPSIYYLPIEIKAKKISISASADPILSIKPFVNKRNVLYPLFIDYTLITVRDSYTEELLSELNIKNVIKLADPTILYDFEDKMNIPINKSFNEKKINVDIWISNKKLEQQTREYLKKIKNVNFVSKNKLSKNNSGYIKSELSRYSQIDVLITDRFHRSIFALKLSSALVINIEREEKNPLPISKGRDLFNSIGIPEYCIRYESHNERGYLQSISELIDNYNYKKYEYREKKLREYIVNNKILWNKIINNIFYTNV